VRADRTREQHLQQLDRAVTRYRADKGIFPSSLEEAGRLRDDTLPVDPESGVAYGYTAQDKQHYRLCATFHAAHHRPQMGGDDGYWGAFAVHPAGPYCFARTYKAKPADQPTASLATG
jgi:hypothetical protein